MTLEKLNAEMQSRQQAALEAGIAQIMSTNDVSEHAAINQASLQAAKSLWAWYFAQLEIL